MIDDLAPLAHLFAEEIELPFEIGEEQVRAGPFGQVQIEGLTGVAAALREKSCRMPQLVDFAVESLQRLRSGAIRLPERFQLQHETDDESRLPGERERQPERPQILSAGNGRPGEQHTAADKGHHTERQ